MSDAKGQMSALLKILFETVDGLTEDEMSELIRGNGKLVFLATEHPPTKPQRCTKEKAVNIKPILELLTQANTRDDAYAILDKADKAHLTAIAHEFKIHVLKSDTRLKITKKVVEGIIGSKLRSDAIRETSLKGK